MSVSTLRCFGLWATILDCNISVPVSDPWMRPMHGHSQACAQPGLTTESACMSCIQHWAVSQQSVHNCLTHISSFDVALIAMSSASVVSPAIISCRLDLQNTQFSYILTKVPDTLFRLLALAKSASIRFHHTALPRALKL